MIKTIFKFIKEHTFIISLISIALCSLSYLCQVFELRKWSIPLGMVDGVRIQYILMAVAGIAYCSSIAYVQKFIISRFNRYIPSYLVCKFVKGNLKTINSLLPNNSDVNSIKDRIKNNRESCSSLKRGILKTLLLVIIVGSLCFFPFYIVFFVAILNSSLPVALACFFINTLIMIVLAFFTTRQPIAKNIKELKRQIRKGGKDLTNIRLDACMKLENQEAARLKKHATIIANARKSTFDYLITPLIAIATFFICILINNYTPPKNDYWIFTDTDGKNYALVFESGDHLIFKNAEISGENIRIFLHDQLSAKTDGLKLKHFVFQSVIIER